MSPQDTVISYNYPQKVIFIVLSSSCNGLNRGKRIFSSCSLCPPSYFQEAAYISILSIIVLCGAWHNE